MSASTTIAIMGAIIAATTAAVTIYKTRKEVSWKRAELANTYLKDFNGNEELVFVGRCLDWYGGELVLPEKLRPYSSDRKTIKHDRAVFERSLRMDLSFEEMKGDIQLYRTAFDSFMSWLSLVSSALERKLFTIEDIEGVEYWVKTVMEDRCTHDFVKEYFKHSMDKLVSYVFEGKSYDKDWLKPLRKDEYSVSVYAKGGAENLSIAAEAAAAGIPT